MDMINCECSILYVHAGDKEPSYDGTLVMKDSDNATVQKKARQR